jgi:hypothetical protein
MADVLSSEGKAPSQSSSHSASFRTVFNDIFWAAAFVTIPLTILTAVLLGLIFANLANTASLNTPGFQTINNSQIQSDAYYIDFSATQLTTIASWCSSVAPLLSGGVMVLFFFHISSIMRRDAESRRTQELPTPLQLSLLIGTSGASIVSLWRWLQYMFRKRRETSVPVLRLSIGMLAFSLFLR